MKKVILYIYLLSALFISGDKLLAEDIASDAALQAEKEVEALYLALDDVLKIAIANNFDIQLAKYDKAIKDTDVGDALSIYDTIVKLEANYTHEELDKTSTLVGQISEDYETNLNLSKKLISGTDVDIDYNFSRTRTDSAFTQINPAEESYIKVSLTQPLLKNILGMNDWGDVRITKIEVANFASETLDEIAEDLADTELEYVGLILVGEMVSIRENAWDEAKAFNEIVATKEEVGSAELTDLYAAKANLKVRKAELLLGRSNRKTTENNLKLLMNIKDDNPGVGISPVDTIDIPDKDILLVPALKVAFDNRRDYKRAMNNIKAKDINVSMKKNERWPQLDLEGSFKMNGVKRSLLGSFQEITNETNTEYYAGVVFSFPLEAREEKSAHDKAKLEKAKALVELKKIERTILLDIESMVKKVNTHRERVEELREAAEFERFKLEEETK
jgi:outer membrane protein TolC